MEGSQAVGSPGGRIGGIESGGISEMGEYDYEIQYIKGKDNHVGDILSRMLKAEGYADDTQILRPREVSNSLALICPEVACATLRSRHPERAIKTSRLQPGSVECFRSRRVPCFSTQETRPHALDYTRETGVSRKGMRISY